MVKSLTYGKPLKLLLAFMTPILIGNIFQQLYSMVDAVIVGRTLGELALGGVGATSPITFLIFGFAQGLTAGFAIIASQYFGAGDENGVRKSVAAAFLLSFIATVVITIVSAFCAMPLLRLMNTPESIIQDSYDYLIALFLGLGATVFYNILASILRAVGDSRTPLIFLIVTSFLNIGLDFLFILVFNMGVGGAGWATVVSQLVSGAACLVYMLKKYPVLRVGLRDFTGTGKICGKELAVGLPMAFQFSITAVGVMAQQTALNGFGDVAVSACSAAFKVDNLASQALAALGTAAATFAGQNYGAGRLDRIKKGVNAGLVIGAAFSVLGLCIILLLNVPLLKLFIPSPTDEMIYYSRTYLIYQSACYFLLSTVFLYRNVLQGMGCSMLTVIAGVTEVAMRFIAVFLLVNLMDYTGLCLSNPVAWLGATVYLTAAYYIVMARRFKKASLSGTDASSVCSDQPAGAAEQSETSF